MLTHFKWFVTPIAGFCICSMFCCALLYVRSSFQSSWGIERWLLCFFVILVSCDWCVALPHGATGLSAVCDSGIS